MNKAMVIELPDGDWFEGDSYTELVASLLNQERIDYTDLEPETQWQIRAELAHKWTFIAGVMRVPLKGEIDPETDERLMVSAAQAEWLLLYDNLEMD